MCGFVGFLNLKQNSLDQSTLQTMMNAISHRGFDNVGMVGPNLPLEQTISGPLFLGHRRLAILDLSESGRQPMVDPNNRAWITYNGELYNFLEIRDRLKNLGYKFKTNTDTEVVLHAFLEWGIDCVRMFNGMFAFALWDNEKQTLYCVRDQLGIKPFYYYEDDKVFAFASESKALAPFHGNQIDHQSMLSYYLGMYVPGTWSIFQGVKKLAPGTVLTMTKGSQPKLLKYWSVDDVIHKERNESLTLDDVESILSQSVNRQLISDVPVGVFLSGGVDSSALSIMAHKNGKPLTSFSVGYETTGYDELPYARSIATKFSQEHFELKIKPHSILSSLDKAIARMTEPIADSALLPNYLLSEMAAEKGIKVILGGTGGDEIFGGYVRYVDYAWHRYMFNRAPDGIRNFVAKMVDGYRPDISHRLKATGFDMFLCAGGLPELTSELFASSRDYNDFLNHLNRHGFPPSSSKERNPYDPMAFDLQVYLPDELLLLGDQTTMAHTVEGRVPLLDRELVEAALSLPFSTHVKDGVLKSSLKEMLSKYMEPGFFHRKKQGFGAPVIRWVQENFAEIRTKLMDTQFDTFPLFFHRSFPIHRYQANQLNVKTANEIFRHYTFCVWYRSLGDL